MLATPTMATTDSGAYGHHQLDCLGMLFGDPKVHETQCGPFTAASVLVSDGRVRARGLSQSYGADTDDRPATWSEG